MNEREIKLSDFFGVLQKCWYWMILAAFLLGAVAFIYTSNFADEEYSSTVSYVIDVTSIENNENLADLRNELTLRVAVTPGVIDVLLTRTALNTFIQHVKDNGGAINESSASLKVALRNEAKLESDLLYSIDVILKADTADSVENLAKAVTAKANEVYSTIANFGQVELVQIQEPSRAVQTGPQVLRDTIIYTLLGAIAVYVGFFIAFLTNTTVSTEEEALACTGAPVFSSIPNIRLRKKATGGKDKNAEENKSIDKISSKLLCHNKDVFGLVESYRTLRTNMLYARHIEGTPVFGVVSAMPSEGKSFNSANIAISFAQIGRKTILVDCDLRRSTQAFMFGVEEGQSGLAEYLAGMGEEPAIIDTGIENLSLLCTGYNPPDPTGLLHSKRFPELIKYLREHYECVIVDLPPVNVVPDAMIVSKDLDGMLLVVEAGKSNFHAVQEAVQALNGVGSTVLGSILNGVELKFGAGYRRYRYRRRDYGYGYGYGYGRHHSNRRRNEHKKSEIRQEENAKVDKINK